MAPGLAPVHRHEPCGAGARARVFRIGRHDKFMASIRSKAQLLEELRDEQAGWEALLQDIGEEHMTQPGVAGEWSIKDVVAHLTFWRQRTVARSRRRYTARRYPHSPGQRNWGRRPTLTPG